MTAFLTWYLILEILGLIALPIAFRLFRWLPDRGYALSKPLGLLLTGYGLWILVSFQFLRNMPIAAVFVMLLVAGGAAYLAAGHREELGNFLRRSWRLILATELIFLVGFAGWTVFRAYNPQLDHTEKPMELAFLNAIRRSETFPPHDPWLAGYTISYYYFGYLLAAMLSKLSGVQPAVAFNLMIALLFVLTLTGAYSLTYNLIEGLRGRGTADFGFRISDFGMFLQSAIRNPQSAVPLSSLFFALFGPLFVALIGNLEGFLDILHSRGIGPARFWQWLDIRDISMPPTPGGWIPARNWWWWRASRVITQWDLLGHHVEIIDEFPFFSFLLGDMHPHVLALPFVMLALGLALNILLGTGRDEEWLPAPRFTPTALLLPFIVGSLAFLHSWDLPTYFGLVAVAYGLRRYVELGELRWPWLRDVVIFATWLLGAGLLLFLPYHIGPRPYTGGIGLVGIIKTRLRHYAVMFGTFLFVVGSLVVAQLPGWWTSVRRGGVRLGTWMVAGVGVPVAGLCVVLGWWAAAFMAVAIGLTVILLFHRLREAAVGVEAPGEGAVAEPVMAAPLGNPVSASVLFALLLTTTALALTFATEFVFVRDRFATRMNTVFKLYYQAWVLLALASAFGVCYLTRCWRGIVRWLWVAGLTMLVLMGLVYPALASYTRAGRFQGEPTLDGLAYVEQSRPAEYAAIQWLNQNVDGVSVILEAPGDSYQPHTSRISAATGLPTLLGWGGHENQWREPVPELGERQADIDTIYRSLDLTRVQSLLEKYDIKYVFVGPWERGKYGLTREQIEKFDGFMERVFSQGDVWIYRR